MIISQKIRIYPNKTTKRYIEDCFSYSRYCYNQGLNLWNELYKDKKSVNIRLVRDYYKNNCKQEWEKIYSPNIFDNALSNLEKAFKNYFQKRSKYPKFKSKHKFHNSFTINRKNKSTIRIIDKRLYLPKFKYGIKLSENLLFNGIIKLCTINKRADKYFANFSIEIKNDDIFENQLNNYVGVDVNINHFDISEENHRFNFQLSKKDIKFYNDKIAYLQKVLSRKVKNSNKYNATKTKLQNIYYKIECIQNDWLHKFTTFLCKNYKNICIEDLNIKSMLKNHKISKSISQSRFYKFKLFLQYKSNLYNNNLIIANKFYPSTQRCSKCGYIKNKKNNDKMKLSDRIYKCTICKNILDRDYNSALNLKIYAESGLGYNLIT